MQRAIQRRARYKPADCAVFIQNDLTGTHKLRLQALTRPLQTRFRGDQAESGLRRKIALAHPVQIAAHNGLPIRLGEFREHAWQTLAQTIHGLLFLFGLGTEVVRQGNLLLAQTVAIHQRMTRRQIIVRLPDRTQKSVVRALDRLERRPDNIFAAMKSLTCDNGYEFLDSASIERSALSRGTSRASWATG